MKKLIVTRHAKSSWNNNSLSDFQRPLNNRGIKDAPVMADRLANRNLIPELVVSSTAVRALETTELLMTTLRLGTEKLITTDSIYEAPLSALEQAVCNLPDHVTLAMIVGHNPGVSSLCDHLCSNANLQMPTCAMACFDLDVNQWADVYRDCGEMLWYDYPKNGQ